ncbi:hypothetical protein DQM28_03190 [Leptospira mayottensis]|uniref:Uncharacterized protein n=1 Tax=Leptospira mayottensis TaxID=1137606 RepID=A0ABM6Y675_9LEPT|nr:hypothetical protein DQM28_03190 [Leptospira mayottensis]
MDYDRKKNENLMLSYLCLKVEATAQRQPERNRDLLLNSKSYGHFFPVKVLKVWRIQVNLYQHSEKTFK